MSTKDSASQNEQQARMTRRDFLRIAGLSSLGGVLAACGAAAPQGGATSAPAAAATAPAAAAAPTAAAPAANTGAKQTVRYLSWWFEEGNRGKTNQTLHWVSLLSSGTRRFKPILAAAALSPCFCRFEIALLRNQLFRLPTDCK